MELRHGYLTKDWKITSIRSRPYLNFPSFDRRLLCAPPGVFKSFLLTECQRRQVPFPTHPATIFLNFSLSRCSKQKRNFLLLPAICGHRRTSGQSEGRILNQHPAYRHCSFEAAKHLSKRNKHDPITHVTFQLIYGSLMHNHVHQSTVSQYTVTWESVVKRIHTNSDNNITLHDEIKPTKRIFKVR
jgi:hypothetical protein